MNLTEIGCKGGTMTNLQAALMYAAASIPVFPCGPDKRPLCGNDWLTKATTNETQIGLWWQQHPDSLVGLPLKPLNLLVVDADRHRPDEDGVALLRELVSKHGPLPAHPWCTTGNNGEHHYFKQPASGAKIGNKKIAKGLETRGFKTDNDGGYVVASGSQLPDGRQWWRGNGSPSLLEMYRTETIPEAPRWLLDVINPPEPEPRPQQQPAKGNEPDQTETNGDTAAAALMAKRQRGYASTALDNMCAELAGMPAESGRNNALNVTACKMGHILAAGWIERSEVEGRLFNASEANGLVKDDGRKSVLATIKSGIEAGLKEPHPPLPDREPPSLCIVTPKEPAPAHAPDASHEGRPPNQLIHTSAEFVAGFVPPEYVVVGLLQRRFIYANTGQTGAGKTAVMLRLAASTALGIIFAGRQTKKARVLYAAAENPDDVRMRWIALAQHMDFDINEIEVYFTQERFKISQMTAKLRAEAEKRGGEFGLVIIDTSPAFFEGDDENSRPQMGKHALLLRSLIDVIPGGPAVVANCHPVKNATADNLLPAGGGSFLNEMDGNLTCARNDSITELHWQGKFRGPDFAPLHFLIKTVTHQDLKDGDGRLIPTVICEHISEQAQEDIARAAQCDENAVLKLINDNPAASQASVATAMGWKLYSGEPHKTKAGRCIKALIRAKLIRETRAGRYKLTPEGEKALKGETD
jgi:Bifunctional DNA primase/polymerase, N-terminal/AAA domain